MPKSGVEAYIYLDFYSDEIYTEDEINKITGVDCSKATFESPLIVKPNQINGVSFTVATEDVENIRHRIFPILETYNADRVEFEPSSNLKVIIEVFKHGSNPKFFVVRKRMPYYLQFIVSEDMEMAKRIFNSTMSGAIKNIRRRLDFAFTEDAVNILVTPLDGRM